MLRISSLTPPLLRSRILPGHHRFIRGRNIQTAMFTVVCFCKYTRNFQRSMHLCNGHIHTQNTQETTLCQESVQTQLYILIIPYILIFVNSFIYISTYESTPMVSCADPSPSKPLSQFFLPRLEKSIQLFPSNGIIILLIFLTIAKI